MKSQLIHHLLIYENRHNLIFFSNKIDLLIHPKSHSRKPYHPVELKHTDSV